MSGEVEIPKVDDRKVRNEAMSRIMNARKFANRGKGMGTFRAMAREAEKEVAKAHTYLLTPLQPASSRPPSRQVLRRQWFKTGQVPEGYEIVPRENT